MSAPIPIGPAELDWMKDALARGASPGHLAWWQSQRFENSRTTIAIDRIVRKYGLRPGHVPKTMIAAHRLATWQELRSEKAVWAERHDHRDRRAAMRWLVRTEAAYLYGHKPGEGLTTREYRDVPCIYLNEEYQPWTPWSN